MKAGENERAGVTTGGLAADADWLTKGLQMLEKTGNAGPVVWLGAGFSIDGCVE